jgi:hypothetical protein
MIGSVTKAGSVEKTSRLQSFPCFSVTLPGLLCDYRGGNRGWIAPGREQDEDRPAKG